MEYHTKKILLYGCPTRSSTGTGATPRVSTVNFAWVDSKNIHIPLDSTPNVRSFRDSQFDDGERVSMSECDSGRTDTFRFSVLGFRLRNMTRNHRELQEQAMRAKEWLLGEGRWVQAHHIISSVLQSMDGVSLSK